MLIAQSERRSQGPLIAFIDLLFLLVAFFVLLLFFIQERKEAAEQQLGQAQQELGVVEESLARIVGEQVDVREAVERLEPVIERFLQREQEDAARRQALAEREKRRRERTTYRLEYTVNAGGTVTHDGRTYTLQQFRERVVAPLREKHWIAFRAYAGRATPFGDVVQSRRVLLHDSNEFDTYWDNLTRETKPAP